MAIEAFSYTGMEYTQLPALGLLAMAFSLRIKNEVRQLQEGKCHCCGTVPCKLQIHHRYPQSQRQKHGLSHEYIDSIENAVGLCGESDNSCHQQADVDALRLGIIYPQVHRRNH